jgi:hypothetical protein
MMMVASKNRYFQNVRLRRRRKSCCGRIRPLLPLLLWAKLRANEDLGDILLVSKLGERNGRLLLIVRFWRLAGGKLPLDVYRWRVGYSTSSCQEVQGGRKGEKGREKVLSSFHREKKGKRSRSMSSFGYRPRGGARREKPGLFALSADPSSTNKRKMEKNEEEEGGRERWMRGGVRCQRVKCLAQSNEPAIFKYPHTETPIVSVPINGAWIAIFGSLR